MSLERAMALRPHQKINHFPGMEELAHKCKLALNLNRMRQVLPDDYSFFPEVFVLPTDYSAFEAQFRTAKAARTFIIKPSNTACGVGIYLTRRCGNVPRDKALVAQRYIHRPLLVDDRKFDLRLYVLVTSFTPLRAYLFKEGLARFATRPYEKLRNSNLSKRMMHLTNYSVNCKSEDFVECSDVPGSEAEEHSSKRTVAFVLKWLDRNGFDSAQVWENVRDVLRKTLIAVEPSVSHKYRVCQPESKDGNNGFSCFDVLGID